METVSAHCRTEASLALNPGEGLAVLEVEEEMPTAFFFNGSTELAPEMSQVAKVVSLIDVAGAPRYAKVSHDQGSSEFVSSLLVAPCLDCLEGAHCLQALVCFCHVFRNGSIARMRICTYAKQSFSRFLRD